MEYPMNLKKLRKEKDLSQIELAELLGVHINTYILWERCVGNPTPENLVKLEKVLGIKKQNKDV